jgi:Uma2 family endonuclease
MMVTTETTRFTREDYMKLPEGFPAQLIEGKLVREPSPTYGHQRTVGRLYQEICALVGDDRRVVLSPIDVFVDRYNVLQPDVCVLAAPLGREVLHVGIPVLVVEVLSPSTAFRDRRQKRRIYLEAGVVEVWIVDPVAETIEIHTRDGAREFGLDEAAASGCVPGVSLRARDVLRD